MAKRKPEIRLRHDLLPLKDKLGTWRTTAELDGKVIAEKAFNVVLPII